MRNDNTRRSSLLDGPDGGEGMDNIGTSSEEALDGGLSELFAPAEPSELSEKPRNVSKRAIDIDEADPPKANRRGARRRNRGRERRTKRRRH